MKKFLSLVLAMIMTMSLVTISAGATEYKDLTDKDEIQYEEAVAVLNRIGVITGYEDGSFRPETELTRGAAAKIIVSLMIGPDAASALPNTTSPYPDVPAGHTFAGVISYCKTAGYISGYGDGTFKPAGTLTGYAFAKMLLGALGYDSDIERFTGTGWTMNVAKIGNVAGLFDRISFDGAAAVNRDQACQLALNTLKGTLVTYGGTSIINGSTGSYTIQGTDAKPITSNNRDINANIGRKDWYGGNNQSSDYLTLEFGEEHFKDLRLEHDRFDPAHDDFGRPSNEWSYKKVTIGTFPLEADFTYTTQVAHVEDNDGTKEKALGLRNYDTYADGGYSVWQGWSGNGIGGTNLGGETVLWLNGLENTKFFSTKVDGKYVNNVADIADFTDNGTLVEVYVSDIDADWITDVVVVQTQLMEVKKVASDYVSLDQKDPDVFEDGTPNGEPRIGFNFAAIDVKVEQVKDTNEECYSVLSGLKEGDEVAVIPVTTDGGKTYEAAKVYVPETVSGTLSRVDTYGIGGGKDDRGAISVTVGGTEYKMADWHKDMWDLTVEKIKATRKDVTLLMDEYGNAMLAKDVGSTNDFMVIGNFYQALSGNKICTYVHGWDIGGTELDLNLGSTVKLENHGGEKSIYGHVIGELVQYTSDGVTGDADYKLIHKDVYDVFTNLKDNSNGERDIANNDDATFEIKASNLLVPLADKQISNKKTIEGTYKIEVDKRAAIPYTDVDYHNYYYDKGVKFIYVTADESEDEVDSIEWKDGAQNVTHSELTSAIMQWQAQACIKKDQVKAVVIKRESNDASLDKMLYVTNYIGMKEYDKESGEKGFEVEALMYKDGKWVEKQNIIIDKDLKIGSFATYTPRESTKYAENFYHVKHFYRHNANPSALYSESVGKVDIGFDLGKVVYNEDSLLRLTGAVYAIDASGKADKDIGKLNAINKSDENFAAPGSAQSYVLGKYRGVASTIDTQVTNPEGVVVTKNAYFLNMVPSDRTYIDKKTKLPVNWRDVDIDETEDLVKKVLDEGYNANVTVLLNEKPDSDGFRTAYLVVINDITGGGSGGSFSQSGNVLYTNSDGKTMFKGNPVGKAEVNSFNNLTWSYDFTAPDWVNAGSRVDYTYDILLDVGNGLAVYKQGQTGNVNLVGSTGKISGFEAVTANCKDVEVRITNLWYDDPVVTYYDGSVDPDNIINDIAWVPGKEGPKHMTRITGSGYAGATNVQLSTRSYKAAGGGGSTAGQLVIDNVTVMNGATPVALANDFMCVGTDDAFSAVATIRATGKGPVNVVIPGLVTNTDRSVRKDVNFPAAYTGAVDKTGTAGLAAADIDAAFDSTLTDYDDTLLVEWDKDTGSVGTTDVTFKATIAAGTNAKANAYDVTIELENYDDIELKAVPVGGNKSAKVTFGEKDIVVKGVKVSNPVNKLAMPTAVVNGKTMTISFNLGVGDETGTPEALAFADFAPPTKVGTWAWDADHVTVTHTVGSATVTVNLDEALVDGDIIKLVAAKVEDATYGNTLPGSGANINFEVDTDATTGGLKVLVSRSA